MVVNIQAFNARGADQRRIYDELDDFQSRRPIDVIKGNRSILILDEPQKMGGKATMDALPKFGPLMILRYSTTHKKKELPQSASAGYFRRLQSKSGKEDCRSRN